MVVTKASRSSERKIIREKPRRRHERAFPERQPINYPTSTVQHASLPSSVAFKGDIRPHFNHGCVR